MTSKSCTALRRSRAGATSTQMGEAKMRARCMNVWGGTVNGDGPPIRPASRTAKRRRPSFRVCRGPAVLLATNRGPGARCNGQWQAARRQRQLANQETPLHQDMDRRCPRGAPIALQVDPHNGAACREGWRQRGRQKGKPIPGSTLPGVRRAACGTERVRRLAVARRRGNPAMWLPPAPARTLCGVGAPHH